MKNLHTETITPDQRKLAVQTWLPEEKPKALVFMVHGLGEHIGRYAPWAELFVKQGLGFCGYDQHGHGLSAGKRGTPGKVSVLHSDALFMLAETRRIYPGLPVILYGHSMGGSVVLSLVLNNPGLVEGLIVTSPWIRLANPPSAILKGLASVLNLLVPELTLNNGLDPSDISRDPAEKTAYGSDPLVHPKVAAGLFHTLDKEGESFFSKEKKITCPTLLMHGTGDRITSWKASEEFAALNSDMVRLKLWNGAYHELHHEPEREDVFAYIMDWLKTNGLL